MIINQDWGEAIEKLKNEQKSSGAQNQSNSSDIKSTANRIYFYSPVTSKSVLLFNEELVKVRNNLKTQAMTQGTETPPISIYIHSPGGSIFAGFSAMDAIMRCDVPTISIIDGYAASAATFLSLAANTRLITKHSYMLIHQLSSGMWGKYEEFKDHMENIDSFMEAVKNIYLEKTKISRKMLKEVLKHDLFFDAKKSVSYGLVDGII